MGVNALVHRVLKEAGIREERFNLKWASAAEAPRFVKLITEFTNTIKELGPLGEAEGLSPDEVKIRIQKALDLVSSQKLRVSFGNVTKAIRKEVPKVDDAAMAAMVEEKLAKTITAAFGAADE
jgi:hypothetical protein